MNCMNQKTDMLTQKKTWIWIIVESILFGLFVYSYNQYYYVQLDGVNLYPFRETAALLSALITLGLAIIFMVIHMIRCIKKGQFKGWLITTAIMLAVALLLIDPALNLVDGLTTWLFHLLPDSLMEQIALWLEPLSQWLKAF